MTDDKLDSLRRVIGNALREFSNDEGIDLDLDSITAVEIKNVHKEMGHCERQPPFGHQNGESVIVILKKT